MALAFVDSGGDATANDLSGRLRDLSNGREELTNWDLFTSDEQGVITRLVAPKHRNRLLQARVCEQCQLLRNNLVLLVYNTD